MSERIQKVLANLGLGSRRAIEAWIEQGRITVNGQVTKLGDKITSSKGICIDGKPLKLTLAKEETRILLYHKPEGEVCTRNDPEGRPTVFDHLPKLKIGRWISIGRLDINTSGLLLFTNDGELANKMMHPSSNIEREYACRIFGKIDPDTIKKLLKGVRLEDGLAKFDKITEGGGEGANRWYHVVVSEGKPTRPPFVGITKRQSESVDEGALWRLLFIKNSTSW